MLRLLSALLVLVISPVYAADQISKSERVVRDYVAMGGFKAYRLRELKKGKNERKILENASHVESALLEIIHERDEEGLRKIFGDTSGERLIDLTTGAQFSLAGSAALVCAAPAIQFFVKNGLMPNAVAKTSPYADSMTVEELLEREVAAAGDTGMFWNPGQSQQSVATADKARKCANALEALLAAAPVEAAPAIEDSFQVFEGDQSGVIAQ